MPLVCAVALNGALLLGAGFVVIARALRAPEPEFTSSVAVELPQEPWQPELEWADGGGAAAAEASVERLALDNVVPDGPVLPAQTATVDGDAGSTDLLSGCAQGFLSEAGFGGMLAGAGTASSAASFFGIEDTGERIVIVVNTSASVLRKARRRGVTIERIQEEAAKLVDGLAGRSLFGLVQFSQGARVFAPHLAPATAANKAALRAWMAEELKGNPSLADGETVTGHEAALSAAFALEPDVVFLVTDGQLEKREGTPGAWTYPLIPPATFLRAVKAQRQRLARPVRIHVIAFELSERDAPGMGELAKSTGGQVRAF